MKTFIMTLVLVLGSCKASVPEGKLACENDDQCPSDWMCLSGLGESHHCFSSVDARDKAVNNAAGDSGREGIAAADGGPNRDSGLNRDASTGGDPCLKNNGGCDPLVKCTAGRGKSPCGACPDGYDDANGDGTRCTDIDECTTDNGGCGDAALHGCMNNDGAAPTCRLMEIDCFNGEDDDADDLIDCADPDCGEGAVCVPQSGSFKSGTVVGAKETCPDGTTETLIHKDLSSGAACEDGCSCTPDPVKCSLDFYGHADVANCGTNSGGTFIATLSGPCDAAVQYTTHNGWRAGPLTVTQTCAAAGTAAGPPPEQWAETEKFCAVTVVGGGCEGGYVCAPRTAKPALQCALSAGAVACAGYAVMDQDWYTGSKDTRTCGACACDASGGSCDGVSVFLGTDYSCSEKAVIAESSEYCGYSYTPPAGLTTGNRIDPTCTASAPISGSLTGTGRRTLCCTPK